MRLRNMLKICLVFWKPESQYAYKRYAYKKTCNLKLELLARLNVLDQISLNICNIYIPSSQSPSIYSVSFYTIALLF